jgi:predicted outer membrane repeat protein
MAAKLAGIPPQKGAAASITQTVQHLGITDNTVIQNNLADFVSSGGGIYNDGGTMILDQAIIQGHSAQSGGGIYNSGSMTLVDVTLSNNDAGGGYGGGIQNWSGNGTLERVTLSANNAFAGGGGLPHFDGLITMINVTISGNLSKNSGGGIQSTNKGDMSLLFITIAHNSAPYGGGIAMIAAGTVTLKNVILDNRGERGNCWGNNNADPLISNGFNMSNVQDSQCRLFQPSDSVNQSLQLSPLGDWGGPTQMHRLGAISPAIDKGQCNPNF